MRRARILLCGVPAGTLRETEDGYRFEYLPEYLKSAEARAIATSFPLREAAFENKILFPFFDGLIPEGWLLDIATENWKLNAQDRMGLLLACCKDCIGAVSVVEDSEENAK